MIILNEEANMKTYPCDNPDSYCPFNATGGYDCRNFCGLGVDENDDED